MLIFESLLNCFSWAAGIEPKTCKYNQAKCVQIHEMVSKKKTEQIKALEFYSEVSVFVSDQKFSGKEI